MHVDPRAGLESAAGYMRAIRLDRKVRFGPTARLEVMPRLDLAVRFEMMPRLDLTVRFDLAVRPDAAARPGGTRRRDGARRVRRVGESAHRRADQWIRRNIRRGRGSFDSGSHEKYVTQARPCTSSTGTGPQKRLSEEKSRLSPIMKRCPGGTR